MRQRNDLDHPLIVMTDPVQEIEPGGETEHDVPVIGLTLVDELPAGPVSTEPGCLHPGCVLEHPHAGPAVLAPDGGEPVTALRQSGRGRRQADTAQEG